MVKKTFRITVKLMGDDAPDLGMGAGVVGYQDVIFNLANEKAYDNVMFLLGIEEQANEVIHRFILAEIREVENEQTI